MNEPINPGEGWRILREEPMRDGDEEPERGFWEPVPSHFHGVDSGYLTIRRRLETQEQKDKMELDLWFKQQIEPPCFSQCWFAALAYARKGES